jgi:predicted PurR-regulated permease PerM
VAAEDRSSHVLYRAVLLAAGLLLFGLLFRQLVTLLLAILITVIVAIPLAGAASRLERHGMPRPVGTLVALLGGITALALVVYLLIPPFVDQFDEFAKDVPRIVQDLERTYADITGEDTGEIGDRVQEFVERCEENPQRLIGPITAIGLNVAGILAATLLILITAYYMAVRPEPLVDGLVSLFPPRRRGHVRHVLARLRKSWVGWMEGVAIDKQRDDPGGHGAAHPDAPRDGRDRRRGRGAAVRVRRPVRSGPDPVADRDLHRGVLGPADRAGGGGAKTGRNRAAVRRAW